MRQMPTNRGGLPRRGRAPGAAGLIAALLSVMTPIGAGADQALFTYHGYLDVDGVPVTGAYDFRVHVRGDAADCTSTLPDLALQESSSVQVSAGRFVLEVGPLSETVNALDALYVRLALKPHEGTDWHSLTGCARILPALRAVRSAPGNNFRVTGALVPDDGTLEVEGAMTTSGAVTATIAKIGNTYPGGAYATFQHKDAAMYALMQGGSAQNTFVYSPNGVYLRAGATQANQVAVTDGLVEVKGQLKSAAVSVTNALTAGSVSSTGAVTAGSISSTGQVSAGSVSSTGVVSGSGFETPGAASVGSLTVAGQATVSGLLSIGVRYVVCGADAYSCLCPSGLKVIGSTAFCPGPGWTLTNHSVNAGRTGVGAKCDSSGGANGAKINLICARVVTDN